ncbi:hypothetical protein [Lysinibacillus fusiformis]|uniref:hypothetical protein n=1 Tax=Lysinibacillus fusiformis TaxID=28031 RepID=UPI001882EBD5|nr:hypothetical protein [Lysinibacillus fusiformis]MBD8521496.1 hypothetical protein [Lysinibacillus fusiformis]
MKKIIIISLLLMSSLAINSAFAKTDIQYFPQDQPPSSLRVISFEGAHDQPYKLINITFRIPPGESAKNIK